MTLKERIKQLANAKGLSLPALEAQLGFGNGTILKWDKSTPNADKLVKVADYFNVSVDYLLGREEAPSDFFMLARGGDQLSKEDKTYLSEVFQSTIDTYLKAKGLNK
ncbi:MAG: helix-turn-helix transcriptional regulator [Cellulosilyticum sp.]|nr:helix-turn-helix transcriptional regulator [Cellulosilyticum sp.]MEE1071103.1 helix-turn-helix transcriptional regulator [Cellulosilyticum sp.]